MLYKSLKPVLENKKTLFLPIETAVRELDYKLILAIKSIEKDMQVVIGQTAVVDLVARQCENGVIIGKNFISNQKALKVETFKQLQFNGIRLFFLHEEAGPSYDSHDDAQRFSSYLNPNDFNEKDILFTWGDNDHDYYTQNSPNAKCKIIKSGSPRMDMAKKGYSFLFDKEIESIKSKHGKIILLNANLSSNSIIGTEAGLDHIVKYVTNGDKDLLHYYIGIFTHCNKLFSYFIEMIVDLSERYPDHTIVLRPHPSEDETTYNGYLKHLSNVMITREGSLISWIKASECVIANYCTTLMEAYKAGIPALNFKPVINDKLNITPIDAISKTCESSDEIIQNLDSIFAGKYSIKADEDLMKNHLQKSIANFIPGVDSFDIISELLKQALQSADSVEIIPEVVPLYERIKRKLRPIKRKLMERRVRSSASLVSGNRHSATKLRGFDEENLKYKLDLLEERYGKKVEINWINSQLVILKT
tara:strand:- start:6566 stop:7993 length:1428 start_codon:yes stop_codon:yes gene_type:complete